MILAPSILFFVTVVWSLIFSGHLEERILKETSPGKPSKVDGIVYIHFMESILAEAAIVFLVNGLTILLVLEDQISGGVQMIVGFVFSMSLLLYLLTSEHHIRKEGIAVAISLVVGFVGGQLLFLLFYGLGSPLLPWLEYSGSILVIGGTSFAAAWRARRHGGKR